MLVLKFKDAFSSLFAATLGFTAYAFTLSEGNLGYFALSQVAVVGVFLLALLMDRNPQGIPKKNVLVWALFVTMLLSNIAINFNNYSNADFGLLAARVAGLSILIFILQWSVIAFNPVRIMVILGFTLTPLVCYATMVSLGNLGVERSAPLGIHPNWWGELLFCYSACALVMPNRVIKWSMLGVVLLLFYLVQSRGAFVASTVTGGIYFASTVRFKPQNTRRYIFVGIVLVLAVIALLWWFGLMQIVDFISNDVFLLNNEYRGVDSDFVGRTEGWSLE